MTTTLRAVAALAIGVLGLLGAVTAHCETPNRAIFVGLSGSVVRVEASRTSGGASVGTGITVAPSIVVTNCHVTRGAAVVRISGSGRLWDVTDQVADTLRDLCFLRVPDWRGKPVVLGNADTLRRGQYVAALGFTGGASVSLRFGRVVALHSVDAGHIIESDAAFTSGASGGGLFDATGALVGLLTFRSRGSSSSYYALPAEWIRDRIPDETQWSELEPLHGARAFWQGEEETLPYFLRVALLESEERWPALLELADRWSAVSAQDAEPVVARGKALLHLQRPRAAAAAFRDALRLAPDDPGAWFGLALADAALGDERGVRDAQTQLDVLDERTAAALKLYLAGRQDDR